jgi:CheY-like chemotaxis protein
VENTKKSKILIVEDEGIVALDLESRLRGMGYVVVGVTDSGREAIQKAIETHPDLVLMDIRLKGDVDGIEAAGVIRARLDIPVIYLTALVDEDTMRRANVTQPHDSIAKPFEEDELRTAIEAALGQR